MAPAFPDTGSFVLANVKVPACLVGDADLVPDGEGLAAVSLTVSEGRIASFGPAMPEAPFLDGRGGIVFPAFVDCHTHIDKGHISPRKPNPDGSFAGALDATAADRAARWSTVDVAARMEFSLRCAHAHGTAALRTHIDSVAPQETISWPVFEAMRERWKGRIALQAASLTGIEAVRDERWFESLSDRVAEARGILGAVTYMLPDLDALLDRMVGAAAERGLDLDFHADETDALDAVSLSRIAAAVLRHKFEGRVLVGHCCSLSRQPDKVVLETLDAVAEAGLSVVSLPLCNMYLQDRRPDRTTPRWRGVTLIHEMKARGIPVAVASDNTRDPFYAYGDLDMLEVYREATRIAHFDHPVGDWPTAVTSTPAAAMGIDAGTLRIGGPADFVLFRGRSWSELLSRPEAGRIVVRDGRPVDATLPDYDELDELMEP